jgi:hypothetical protein
MCTVQFIVKDSWGEPGTASIAFDVANPQVPAGGSNLTRTPPRP